MVQWNSGSRKDQDEFPLKVIFHWRVWKKGYTPRIQWNNGPNLKMYFLWKMGIFQPAMLVYQRVIGITTILMSSFVGWFFCTTIHSLWVAMAIDGQWIRTPFLSGDVFKVGLNTNIYSGPFFWGKNLDSNKHEIMHWFHISLGRGPCKNRMTRIMPFLFLHPASQEFLWNPIFLLGRWQANHANTISECGLVFSLKGRLWP